MRIGWLHALVACGLLTAFPALAENTPPHANTNQENPGLLNADDVTFDESTGIVTASGNVELLRDGRTLYADTVTYNQNTKVVVASGNIRIFENTGDVTFSDYIEITDDMRNAFINNVRALLTDNSRLIGNEAERTNGRYMRVSRGVYTPCDLCKSNPSQPPVWQLKGKKIVHDNEDKDIRYSDAVMEMFGVPVFYLPYFSHPDPTVKRRSGFLMPLMGNGSNTGSFFRSSYYVDIDPDRDMTVETGLYSQQGLLLGAEWRQRFDNGQILASGSFIPHQIIDPELERRPNAQPIDRPDFVRGHFYALGSFDINDHWRSGFDLAHVSDVAYLRQFYSFRENVLTSRAWHEGFYGRDYAAVTAYRFQDMRVGNPEVAPFVFPLAEYSAFGEPGETWGGRWSFSAGLLGIKRDRSNATDSTRISMEPGWRRDFVSDTGLITTVTTSARTDVYNFQTYQRPDKPPGQLSDGNITRFMPQAQIMFRYPLARHGETMDQVLEPIFAFSVATRERNDFAIPNEDARDIEFDDTNLFMTNRYSGFDRQEGGQRLSYGLRASLFGRTTGSARLFLGQSHRISQDHPYGPGTGLESQRSDYVGRLELMPLSWVYLDYGFRYDRETLESRRHNVTASFGVPALSFGVGYHFMDTTTDPNYIVRNVQEYANIGVNSRVAQHWSLSVSHSQSINPSPGPRATTLGLTYVDECLVFQTSAMYDHTTPPGAVPGHTVYFRLIFRNIGEIKSPSLTPSIFTGTGTNH
ncbi:LPS-assembly protein LptD [Azospirillaceae bacterium]